MIHIVNKAGYMQGKCKNLLSSKVRHTTNLILTVILRSVMRRCPMLGSIWIWSIVQLDLPSALVSLAVVVAYVKYNGLSVIFPS